jgi:hypothetical protein
MIPILRNFRESSHLAAWLIVIGDEAEKTGSRGHYDTHIPYSAILRSVLEIGNPVKVIPYPSGQSGTSLIRE